jgi:hypothetical protein
MSCLLCGELPESYFGRLRVQGVPLDKHLLVPEFGQDPHLLKFDRSTYDIFRTKRCQEIWQSVKRIVDPEDFRPQTNGAQLMCQSLDR